MNTGIFGKYRSGKSYLGVHLVERALLSDRKPIMTTLALDLPALNDYMQRHHPDVDTQVLQRTYVMDKNQMAKFWRLRGITAWGEYGPELQVFGPPSDQGSKEKGTFEPADPRWELVTQGVHYIIDEAPVRFKAREWPKNGPECTDYLTQHAKLGDQCWFIARTVGMLDKQLRDSLDQCIIMDNWYKRLIGMFTAPRKIKCYYFEDCPPQRGTPPAKTEDIYINAAELAACYFTEKGIGIGGTDADKGQIAKGIPWWFSIAGVAVGVILFYVTIHYAMGGALHLALRKNSLEQKFAPTTNAPQGPTAAAAGLIPHLFPAAMTNFTPTIPPPPPHTDASQRQPEAKIQPRNEDLPQFYGYCTTGAAGKAQRIFVDSDGGLIECASVAFSNHWVYVDGVLYYRSHRPTPESPRFALPGGRP